MGKILRFLLVERVQEYYLINFTIITVASFFFHFQDVLLLTTESPKGPLMLGLLIIFVFPALGFMSWLLVKHKTHDIIRGNKEIISFLPLLVLTSASIMSLITSLETSRNTIEIVISSVLLLFYGQRLFILIVYSYLIREGFTKNIIYKAIKQRLESALGDYQVSFREALFLMIAGVSLVYMFTFLGLNIYVQYLLAFSTASLIAFCLQKTTDASVIKS